MRYYDKQPWALMAGVEVTDTSEMECDGIATLTEADMEVLRARGDTTVYTYEGREVEAMDDEERERACALLRAKYTTLLASLPEATDDQLRTLLLEETPFFQRLFDTTVVHVVNATCRGVKRGEFKRFIAAQEWIRRNKPLFDEATLVSKYLEYADTLKLDFQARDRMSYVENNIIKLAAVSDDMRALLAVRRERGERPGAHLLNDAINDANAGTSASASAGASAETQRTATGDKACCGH